MNITNNDNNHDTPHINFTLHGLNITPGIPAHIRDSQRTLIFNAQNTDHRRRKAMHVPPRGPADNPHPCFFCGTGQDSTPHIYGDCAPLGKPARISSAASASLF